MSFAVLGGLLLAMGTGLLGRWLLGLPAAVLALPLRRLGAAGMLAGTGLAANKWRTATLAAPVMLVTMLAGTQAVVESSNQRDTEVTTAARVQAPWVVVGAAGAPLPAGAAGEVAPGRRPRRHRGGHDDRASARRGARPPQPVGRRRAWRPTADRGRSRSA